MWGFEDWGTMLWGGASPVPMFGPLGLGVLLISFLAGGYTLKSRRRTRWAAVVASTVLILGSLAAIAAVTLPNAFVNGTVADADQVNENFDAIAADFAKWTIQIDDPTPLATTVSIPDSVLVQLCADEDGCKVRITLRDWNAPGGKDAPVPEFLLLYEPAAGYYRTDSPSVVEAFDGDGVQQHLGNAFGQCFLTDGEWLAGASLGDAPGLNFLRHNVYPAFSSCSLTLID